MVTFTDAISSIIPSITVDSKIIEYLNDLANYLSPPIERLCQEAHLPVVDVIPVGSAFRNTMLPQKIEIDLFVRFDTKSRKILSSFADLIIEKLAKELKCDFQIRYAENPYGTLFYENKEFNLTIPIDVVATIWIPSPDQLQSILKKSGMARTPFHVNFLKKIIKNKEKEVKLFKYWCKKKFLYGQCGFTGFLCELLIGKFGTFENLLLHNQSITNLMWDPSEKLNDEKLLIKKFPRDLVIIMDPIDPNRNAAAGIQGFYGKLQLKRFEKTAQHNLDNPNDLWKTYELPKPYFLIDVKFSFNILSKAEDEIIGRLIALTNGINRQLEIEENSIEEAIVSRTSIMLKTIRLNEKKYLRKGPPLSNQSAAKKFRNSNPEVVEKDNRLWVEDKFYSSLYTLTNFFDSRKDISATIKEIK